LPYLSSLRILLIIAFINLSAGCGGGGDSGSSTEPVVKNKIPSIVLSEDLTINELQNVVLEATAEDKDGTITSSIWKQVSGEEVNIINADSLKMSFQSPKVLLTESEKSLVFKITVTDNLGASSQAEITITVQPVNENPIANAGEDRIYLVGEAIQLDCLNSNDPDGFPVLFEWVQTKGPQIFLSSPNSCNPTFQLPDEPVEVELSLTVIDEDETSALDTVVINSRNYTGVENAMTKESLILRDEFSDFSADNITIDRSKGIAFTTDGHNLRALDISDPFEIKDFGWAINRNFSKSKIIGDLLIAHSWYELWIFDISDINNITNLSVVEASSTYRDFELVGNILYIASGSIGIKAFNISNPRSPIELDTSVLNNSLSSGIPWVNGIKIIDNLLYATTRVDGLKVFDINDLSQASLAGEMECICLLGKIEINDELMVLPAYNRGIILVNLNEPTAPEIISETRTLSASFNIALNNNLLSVGNFQKGIEFLDISNPNMPEWVGKIPDVYNGISLYMDDDVLFLTEGFSGVKSFEITSISLPVVDKYELDTDYKINAFAVDDDKLFISSMNERLSIFDISSIEETSLIGELSIQTSNSIILKENALFLTSDDGLNIVNIEDAANPNLLSSFASSEGMFSIDVNDKLAVVSEGFLLKSLNIENLEDPTQIDEIRFSSVVVSGITLNNNIAFVTNAYSDISVLNNTNSFEQQTLSEYDGGSSSSLAIYKNYAYSGGVVFDITDTNDLVKLKEIEGFGSKVKIVDNMLYTIDQDIGVSKYSISNPTEPKLVSSYQLNGRVGDIGFNNNQVFNLEYSNNGWDLQDYYSVFDFDKSLKVSSNYTHLSSNARYSYSAVWQLDTKVKLGCYVSGGECEIVHDSNNKSAEVFWVTPEIPGDYQITIVIGNTSFFDSYEDRVIIE